MDYGLYVHLPYCRSLCPYCAFAKAPLHRAEPERLLGSLERERALAAAEAPRAWTEHRPRTAYAGGGTPTALDESTLGRFVGWMRGRFDLGGLREWTVEANPEGLSAAKLRILRDGGVTRISLGMQSLEPAVLKRLGRIHTADEALLALDRIGGAGFRNVSVDLMTAVPGETRDGFRCGLSTLIERGVPHVSIYALQIEEGTPFAAKAARGALRTDEDAAAERYDDAAALLAAAGYHHYEVASWSLPGFESRHNQGYWTRRPYLGLGPGAHSFDGTRRWGNEHDVSRWFEALEEDRLPREDVRALGEADAAEERVFLGLRRSRGIRRRDLERAAPRASAAWERWAESAGAIRPGLRTRIRPTERGLLNSVEISAELLALSPRQC